MSRFIDALRRNYLLSYGIAITFGLVAGIISATGKMVLVAMFAGLVLAAVLMSSRKALLWFVIIGGLVIAGAAQLYLPGSRYLRYLVPLAAIGLIFHGIMDHISKPASSRSSGSHIILSWAFLFLIIAVVSAVVNWDGPGVAIMGFKGYFQMWIFFFAMILIQWQPEIIRSIPRGLLFIALLQLPFVLHEYLILVPKRMGIGGGIVPVDVVSGTFGGTLYGGGANAVLAAFLMTIIACLLGLWKHGVLSRFNTIVLSLIFLSPLLVNEAKISALYFPLVFIVLFYRDIVERPLRFLVAGGVAFGALAVLLTALTLGQPSGKLHTWSDLVGFTFDRQTASIAGRKGQYSELSRWTALTFWSREHVSGNPVHFLIGHGPGASRVQAAGLDLAETLAEKRYGGLQIGYTAVSALLWDMGVIGLFAVLGLFFSAFRAAGRLSSFYRDRDRFLSGLFDGLRAGISVLTLSLAHKDFFAFHIPYQTLVMLIFAFIVIFERQVGELEAESSVANPEQVNSG